MQTDTNPNTTTQGPQDSGGQAPPVEKGGTGANAATGAAEITASALPLDSLPVLPEKAPGSLADLWKLLRPFLAIIATPAEPMTLLAQDGPLPDLRKEMAQLAEQMRNDLIKIGEDITAKMKEVAPSAGEIQTVEEVLESLNRIFEGVRRVAQSVSRLRKETGHGADPELDAVCGDGWSPEAQTEAGEE